METALAQIRMTGAADGGHGLVARHQRRDERRARRRAHLGQGKQRRHHRAARMHRALPVAIVELDAVGSGAAQEGSVQEIGAPRASRHRDAAGGPHRCQHRLGAGRDLAAGACDHHPDRVHEMPLGVVADLFAQLLEVEVAHQLDERFGCSGACRNCVQGFGGRHEILQSKQGAGPMPEAYTTSFASASTATTPSPAGRTISGLISASRTAGPSAVASRDKATIACASAARSPAGRPR
jgi:hypothetical protein